LYKPKDKCHKCNMHGHWSCTCRTPKHLTSLYQTSPKQNTLETNFIHKDNFKSHNFYLDISDFFENLYKTDNILSGGILRDD